MNLGTGNRKQVILAAVLGVAGLAACVFIYEEVADAFGWNAAPAPATASQATTTPVAARTATAEPPNPAASEASGGKNAKTVATSSASLDPTLHMEAMLVSEQVQYAGSGRNIFSPNSAPPLQIPRPLAPARNVAQAPPPPPQPVGPPPPPPIDLKFFGYETAANGQRQAFLLHGDNVYMAAPGDVVMRRYRVISIDPRSIQVEDMQNNNRQMLPLLSN